MPQSGLRAVPWQGGHSEGHLDSFPETLPPSSLSLPALPHPHKGIFSNRAISEKGERAGRLAVWPISASVTPLQPGIGRVLVAKETLTSGRLTTLEAAGTAAPQSCGGRGPAPALGQQGPSLPGGREPSSTKATAVFSFWPYS